MPRCNLENPHFSPELAWLENRNTGLTRQGRLIFAHHAAAELLQALQGLGAMGTAERTSVCP